jgi:hypothetical protein
LADVLGATPTKIFPNPASPLEVMICLIGNCKPEVGKEFLLPLTCNPIEFGVKG